MSMSKDKANQQLTQAQNNLYNVEQLKHYSAQDVTQLEQSLKDLIKQRDELLVVQRNTESLKQQMKQKAEEEKQNYNKLEDFTKAMGNLIIKAQESTQSEDNNIDNSSIVQHLGDSATTTDET